jgi:hypothetical protein
MKTKLFIFLFLASRVLGTNLLFAQFMQQGPKLVGTGGVGSSYQGQSVAISSDGNTAIIGGPFDNSGTGAGWVLTRSGGVWTQQGPKLVGTGSVGIANRGWSVAISSDGNTAIIGGPGDNSLTGAVWVFTQSGGVWTQQGPKLVGTGAIGSSLQGQSVAISSDGNTVIEGGYKDNGSLGAVWIFTRSGGVWTQQGTKLVGTGAAGIAWQGWSVGISSDGNTAILGGPVDNSNAGAVWIFTRSGVVWTQQGPKLIGTGAVGSPQNGVSVGISSDGNTAIEGGNLDNNHAGAVWIFTRSGGVWTQQGPKLVGTGTVGNPIEQGWSAAISSDGNTAIVGGPLDNNQSGAIWVFNRSGGVWTQQGTKLIGTGATGADRQGYSVAISSNGGTVIEGGLDDNSNIGAVWVFVNPSIGITPISSEVPKSFSLSQNYPNPFNPNTVIKFQVTGYRFIKLSVYDILGKEVSTLVNEQLHPGTYEVNFDGTNLPSGVYFYNLSAGDYTETKKMILIK